MKNNTVLASLAAVAAVGSMLLATPEAEAMPGQCGPDGTWMHCETVYVLGFGGTNCFRVRPVPTNVDPRGWVPA